VFERLRPHADAWEEAGWFPDDVFAMLAERGWLGLKYGGDWVADAVLCEELARCGSGGVAAGIGAHLHIATPPVFRFGTDAQRERWLAPAMRGELIGALAITEPDVGSDVAAVRTRAERVDGGWLVSGAKTYITNGVRAHFYVTAVRTGAAGHGGLSFLVLERGEGIQARALSKLGWRASDTAELAFDEVFVPDEHLLGEEGRGFYLIMANFQWERLVMALGAVGAMRRTLERAAAELRGRGQATRHRVAELATRAEAGTAMTYHALRLYLGGADAVREVTMAKLATQRANFELQDECLRLVGPDPELERAARDARLGPIGGGTDEIMREILGRAGLVPGAP
jgi:acyl-CoA dehydrogenase